VCERCAAPAVRLAADHAAGRAMRCLGCDHGWFVPAENPTPLLRRKPDRRRESR